MAGFGLIQTAPPTDEPVDLPTAKKWCKVDGDDDDDLIQSLVTSARVYVETNTGRSLLRQSWRLTLDYFPGFIFGTTTYEDWPLFEDIIRMPRAAPLISLDSIKFMDPTLTLQTLNPSQYQVDGDREPARVRPAVGKIWPVTYAGYFGAQLASVQVAYTAGYANVDAVPAGLKSAIRVLVASWYENREAVSQRSLTTVPMAVESLLAMHATGEYR